MNLVIDFSPDGTATCLWSDALPLVELGRLQVHRASNIEFNPDTQQWEVHIALRNNPAFTHPSRQACLDWEVQTLQATV